MASAHKRVGGEFLEILKARSEDGPQNVGGKLMTILCAAGRFRHDAINDSQPKHVFGGQFEDSGGVLFVVPVPPENG